MKTVKGIVLVLFLLSLSAMFLQAENLQVAFNNLQNGYRYADCSNILIKLDASVDNSTISEIRVYSGKTQIARIRKEPWEYEWENVVSAYYRLYAKVVDAEKNEAFSDTIGIVVGNLVDGDLAMNGRFTCSTKYWSLQNNEGASGVLTWAEDAEISEGGAVSVTVNNPGTADWHIQLAQSFPIYADHTYEVSFIAETPEPKDIQWMFQENTGGYTIHGGQVVTVDGNNYYGPFEFVAEVDDPNNAFRFYIGANNVPILFDDIMIIDTSVEYPPEVTAVKEQPSLSPDRFAMIRNYPNPFNATAHFDIHIPYEGHTELVITNIRGERVKTLINGNREAGDYQLQWDGTADNGVGLTSGLFIATLRTHNTGKVTTKLLLVE
ncbi:hypothetical protein JW948_18150 [bacterium]|nr:hypothetical protein [bacterium]